MQFINTFSATAVLGMLATTTAHMVIHQPVPYGQNTLLNGPLADDGSDFPCKQRAGVYDITAMNNIQVGVPQTLSFMGGATHSGGSCQVSVSLDKEPTKDSQWKVVHSIIGGCPSNYTGNLVEDASALAATVYSYQLPKGMPNGQYSLAWTWLNKVGNREFYMNCAPITVTGGADNNDVFDKLPDMFVINQPSGQCSTVEGEDFVYPSPGDSVETPFSTALGSKTQGSGCASVTIKGAGKGVAGTAAAATASGAPASYGSGASTAATSAPAQASTVSAYSSPPAGSQGGLAVQATGSADSSIVTVTTMATVTSASPSSSALATTAPASSAAATPAYSAPAGGDSNSTTSSGSCSNGSVACSSPGAVVCIGSTQFGICDINNCAVPEALASGTTCSNGVIAKRSMKHGWRHLAGRRSF